MFIGKKPQSKTYPRVIWTKNEKGIVPEALRALRKLQINNENAKLDQSYNIYTPKVFPFIKDSWKIISYNEEVFIRDLEIFVAEEKLIRISELFAVNQGLRQGNRDAFKISKMAYSSEKNKSLFRPVVDNSAVNKGFITDANYIWYPYNKEGIIFKEEKDLAEISFFKKNLKPIEPILRNRAGISEWWGHTRPRNWQFEKKLKLVSTEFGNSASFAFDKSGEYVVERGNAWIPKKKFETDDYYFYLAIFSSSTFDRLLSIYSKPIMSGYYLGQIYTKDIPVPNVSRINKDETNYLKLVHFGKELVKGNSSAVYSINDEVQNFYPKI